MRIWGFGGLGLSVWDFPVFAACHAPPAVLLSIGQGNIPKWLRGLGLIGAQA